jgi:hypothetical protein
MARTKKEKTGPGRLSQMRQAYAMTRKGDPLVTLIVLGTFVIVFGVILVIGFIVGNPITFGIVGVVAGLLAALVIFGRRAEKAAVASIADQPGAAAGVLSTLRKGWTMTPAVGGNRQQDLVHRVTGRPGVVLVAEGRPQGTAALLNDVRKRTARVTADVPITEIIVGDGEGQVPLRKLSRTVMKLPRVLQPAEVTELNYRLKALGSQQGTVPLPKGPLPKGVRPPKMSR